IARGSMADLGMDRLAPRWVALGALTVPAFLLVGAGWVALLEMLGVEVQQQELLDVAGAGALRPADWAALAYGAVGAPLVEEVVFRGLVFSALARAGGEARAAVGSGVMFGLLHVAEPAAVGPLVVMGIVLGFLRARSGSLAPAVALHLGNNVLAMGLVLAGVVRG
ncbi:MAG: CPBP family intramembrane glutamic endopeptidase, partial [Myxococcota bacterium]|nr:CPBP family intramembrane glutamic endopeptidase [Myxococcota bacterium]